MKKSNSVFFVNDMPFGLAFGGKEIQLLGYKSIIDRAENDINVQFLDMWDREQITNDSVLHFFGSGKWFHNLLIQAEQKTEVRKCVISPTFYYDKFWKIKAGEILSRFILLDNQFSYKRYIFSTADLIVVNSNAEGNQISHLFGANLEKKLVVIPNTIDDDFTRLSNTDCFLHTYNLAPGYILSVGFLDERKNSIGMINAFLRTYHKTNRKLVIIGGYRFLNPKNRVIAHDLITGNLDRIVHIPFLDANSEIIKSAYFNCVCHFLPSFVETPGIANLEALAFNKPIIVGDCAPVREYFRSHAIYCNPNSSRSMEKSIIEGVSEKGSGTVRADFMSCNYTHRAILQKLLAIYA